MILRDRIRAWRMYLRSYALFRSTFSDPEKVLWLPYADSVEFHLRETGTEVVVPGACWSMLPTACRLLQSGAVPSWEDGMLKVRFGDIVLYAPALDKSIGLTLKEIFIDDVYGLRNLDLKGRTVLDVGAYIGDSAIAFAGRGAYVHAFEPMPIIQKYLARNIAANRLDNQVRVHPVGLSGRNERITVDVNLAGLAGAGVKAVKVDARAEETVTSQELQLVNAFDYLRSAGIASADVVKLDCEECEYALLQGGALLEMLRPSHVMMEYHRGGAPLHDVLIRHGFSVNWPEREKMIGYMAAVRI